MKLQDSNFTRFSFNHSQFQITHEQNNPRREKLQDLNFHRWWGWFLLLLPTICDAFNVITRRKKWDGKSLLQDFQTFTKKINDFKFNTNAQIEDQMHPKFIFQMATCNWIKFSHIKVCTWKRIQMQIELIISHLTFHEGHLHIIMWNLKKTWEEFWICDFTKIYGN